MKDEKLVKVNLGSGRKSIDGWICIDNSPKVVLAKFPRLIYVEAEK